MPSAMNSYSHYDYDTLDINRSVGGSSVSMSSSYDSQHDFLGSDRSTSPDDESKLSQSGSQAVPKKKQKRNKPTLSCSECVERKTKCDRARPCCLACVKRQSLCRYTDIANLIAANGNGRSGSKSKHPKKHTSASISSDSTYQSAGLSPPRPIGRTLSSSSGTSSPFLLSNVPYSNQPDHQVFGTGSQHPFANYWTAQGGLPEIVGVLPPKDQADTLIAKYFESVDPVYPMLHKEAFYVDYDAFWALSHAEKCYADASQLALHFAMYAMGAQFLQMESDQSRQQISQFYISASHQSLRLYPFLSRTSLRSIQAMVLMAYFLMNDNKATDAWAFCGILTKQAYAMGLNRDPEVIVPKATPTEKNQRRKAWQAVYYLDTFFTVLVKLPPTTGFADVLIDSLTEDMIEPDKEASIMMNPMSISSIAPRQTTPSIPTPPHTSETTRCDTAYIRWGWRLAELVQRTICQPRALEQSLASSPRHKAQILAMFQTLYASLPTALSDSRSDFFSRLVSQNPRIARQNLFLRSNFWHCVMVIQADSNELAGVQCDIRGALEAGRMALNAFFDFWDGLRGDASVWWTFQHRAFDEALTMSSLLSAYYASSPMGHNLIDPLLIGAQEDIAKVLEILEHVGLTSPEIQKTRTDVLRSNFEAVRWNYSTM